MAIIETGLPHQRLKFKVMSTAFFDYLIKHVTLHDHRNK